MTTSNASSGENTAVPSSDVVDRVSMLSLSKDGTPDQTHPVLIGDVEATKKATREQFAQQAVSAADDAARVAAAESEKVEQDPTIAAQVKEHEKVAKAAEKAADKVVDQLHTDA